MSEQEYTQEQKKFWDFVEKANYQGDKDYDRVKYMLMLEYGREQAEALDTVFRELQGALYNRMSDVELPVSDDGYSDLTAHIVGCGRAAYELAMGEGGEKEVQRRADDNDYSESFAYCFPFSSDWDMIDTSAEVEQAALERARINEYVMDTKARIEQLQKDLEAGEAIRDNVGRMLKDVESGQPERAIEGVDIKGVYSDWAKALGGYSQLNFLGDIAKRIKYTPKPAQ